MRVFADAVGLFAAVPVLLLLVFLAVPSSCSPSSPVSALQEYAVRLLGSIAAAAPSASACSMQASHSSYYRKLVIHTHYGLGNRIISLVSAVALAIVDERSLAIIWDGVEELLVFPFNENVVISEEGPFIPRACSCFTCPRGSAIRAGAIKLARMSGSFHISELRVRALLRSHPA
jgi:hypothetical protein